MAKISNPYDGAPFDKFGFNLVGEIKVVYDGKGKLTYDCVDVNTEKHVDVPTGTGMMLVTTTDPGRPEFMCSQVKSKACIPGKKPNGFQSRFENVQIGGPGEVYKAANKSLMSVLRKGYKAYLYVMDIPSHSEIEDEIIDDTKKEIKSLCSKQQKDQIIGFGAKNVAADILDSNMSEDYEELAAQGCAHDEMPKVVEKTASCTDVMDAAAVHQTGDTGYWWLSVNPNTWDYSKMGISEKKYFPIFDEKGQLKRRRDYFMTVKPGDKIIGYVSTPVKAITALCTVTAGQDGKHIVFIKDEDLLHPVPYKTVKTHPGLRKMQFCAYPFGTLFKLTKDEYETIMRLIRAANPANQ